MKHLHPLDDNMICPTLIWNIVMLLNLWLKLPNNQQKKPKGIVRVLLHFIHNSHLSSLNTKQQQLTRGLGSVSEKQPMEKGSGGRGKKSLPFLPLLIIGKKKKKREREEEKRRERKVHWIEWKLPILSLSLSRSLSVVLKR